MNKDLRNWLWALLLLDGCVAILFASQPLTCKAMSMSCIDENNISIYGTVFNKNYNDTIFNLYQLKCK